MAAWIDRRIAGQHAIDIVQIWISSAPMPAPTIEAVKSEPPRPRVVPMPFLGGRDEASHHDYAMLGMRRNCLGETRIGLRVQADWHGCDGLSVTITLRESTWTALIPCFWK